MTKSKHLFNFMIYIAIAAICLAMFDRASDQIELAETSIHNLGS